ncbi:MAG TPA: hypothetical protein VGM56_08930 [Byssovorax sp.]|jgi:hypothetical protein
MEPLELLDPRIRAAAHGVRAAAAALRLDDDPADVANPLGRARSLSSRDVYKDLGDAPKTPIVEATRVWVGALTLERVLWTDAVRVEVARRASRVEIDLGGAGETISVDATLARMLLDTESGRRRVLASALEHGAGEAKSAARVLAERRAEAARQLGVDRDALEVPLDEPAALVDAARRALDVLDAARPPGAPWSDALDRLLARDAGEGWPAHVTPRWLVGSFAGTGLVDGLRLAPVKLPAPLGASSFARALGAFGGAWFDAGRPPSAPFVLACAPFDVHRARRVALFAGLAAEPAFHVRALGLGKARAMDQARKVARALAVSLRLDASRALLRGAFELAPRAADQAFEEHNERALGAPIPASLAGVFPRVSPDDAARFVGQVLAARDRRELVERFDEDWFRSPHAARALREEDAVVAPAKVPRAAVDAGLKALEAEARVMLG